jgi:hypothetical protein
MELAPYVESLRADLLRAADTAGPEGQAVAERLALALEPAMRMALLEALSDSAAEITADLPHAAVEVRLKGREPQFVVSATEPLPTAEQVAAAEAAPGAEEEDDGAVSRVTVRIPESLKSRAEEAAASAEQSLNTWIVTAIRRAITLRGGITVDVDLGSLGGFMPPQPPRPPGPPGFGPGAGRQPRRIQGWVR